MVKEIFDEFMDLNNYSEVKVVFNKYRFFGRKQDLPNTNAINLFFEFNAKYDSRLNDKDKVYLPLIRLERKIIFENQRYGQKVQTKNKSVNIKWGSIELYVESMNEIIVILLNKKKKYIENSSRNKDRQKLKKSRKETIEEKEDEEESEDEEDTTEDSEDNPKWKRRQIIKPKHDLNDDEEEIGDEDDDEDETEDDEGDETEDDAINATRGARGRGGGRGRGRGGGRGSGRGGGRGRGRGGDRGRGREGGRGRGRGGGRGRGTASGTPNASQTHSPNTQSTRKRSRSAFESPQRVRRSSYTPHTDAKIDIEATPKHQQKKPRKQNPDTTPNTEEKVCTSNAT